MAEAPNISRFLNPWALHLQKLGLEVKCPLCLNLLTKPTLLPCDHILCNYCVPRSIQFGSECPVCKHQYTDQEIRAAPHMETMVAIYKNLDATFSANALQSLSPDGGRLTKQSPISISADDKSSNEQSMKAIVSSDPNKKNNTNNGHGMPYNEEIDVNQLRQQSPGYSFSSDDNKNLDRETSKMRNRDIPKAVPDQHLLKGSVCAFCRSSKTTEETGPFLYFANGREVVGNVNSLSKVICVHRKCRDWTPQVYYDGDIIKNLELEVARAAKLKCSSCGVKGAALGCYVKSCRRSYHVPCAFQIQDCRWDMDNFVMLCPIHRSVKFPSEKSKSRKHFRREVHPETSPLTTEQLSFWARSSDGPKEWALCGSALSSEEKYILVNFANTCGATVCKFWKPNVTHVVAATDEMGACTRTMKVLMAILSGKWILTVDWVKACIAANGPVNEEFYEISLDNHGCSGGPKAGRLRASTNAPKLFDGFEFYLIGDFVPAYKSDLLDLVEKAGGAIVQSKEQLVEQTHTARETHPATLVVYNHDPPRCCSLEDESNILQQRLSEAEGLAKRIGCQVIKHTWILESIAAYKLVPFC